MENKKHTGIWIDSKRAIIVKLDNGSETIKKVDSGINGRTRVEGEGKQYTRMGKQYFPDEKKEDERKKHLLNDYFKHVVEEIHDADSIMIIGPAEAKTGLQKVIAKDKTLANKIALVESEDHLTDNQIAAKVRDFYKLKNGKNDY